jgi:hypothetical protein
MDDGREYTCGIPTADYDRKRWEDQKRMREDCSSEHNDEVAYQLYLHYAAQRERDQAAESTVAAAPVRAGRFIR